MGLFTARHVRPDPAAELASANAVFHGRPVVPSAFHGHLWTVAPHLLETWFAPKTPADEPWSAHVEDPQLGALRLTGWLYAPAEAESCVVIIHGLGGRADGRYVNRTAQAAADAGMAYLRLNLRGCDRSGEDLYHAGLTDDLRAALASEALARFRDLFVVGYSLGGQMMLRWATEPAREPRVRALAAVCSPLDLSYGAQQLQRPLGRPYQRHLMVGLKEMYEAAHQRQRRLPQSLDAVRAMKTLLEWDDQVIAPRFGFRGCEDYYEKVSAGRVLPKLEVPTLFVAAEADPMVTAAQLRPWLADASDALDVRWTVGGHVGFPPGLDLGVGMRGGDRAAAAAMAQPAPDGVGVSFGGSEPQIVGSEPHPRQAYVPFTSRIGRGPIVALCAEPCVGRQRWVPPGPWRWCSRRAARAD